MDQIPCSKCLKFAICRRREGQLECKDLTEYLYPFLDNKIIITQKYFNRGISYIHKRGTIVFKMEDSK